ncbi:KRI1-like family C-terminal-domain-containing protein [Peziza echinospora]|nr:KRI1-like family C-terminal-domain-containing protein [Peziza echinospora]
MASGRRDGAPKHQQQKKLTIDFDGDDDQDAPVELKVNEAYAKKFEYNKKREELQRLEEKFKKSKRKRNGSDDGSTDYGDDDGDSDDSSSEDEDEYGVLADSIKDSDIMATINAIRTKDPRVYDGQTRFFKPAKTDDDDDDEEEEEDQEEEKQKPMYLKDYHRENLLKGIVPGEEEDNKPKTYLQQQDDLKRSLVQDMHKAAETLGSDDEDDFLTTRSVVVPDQEALAPPDPETADPENPDAYLNSFLASKAWLPKDKKNVYGPALESDDSEEDDAIDQFEQGFNLRFEDPSKAAQLVGHARGAVKMMSARKDGMSARKRARELKKQKKEDEKKQREIDKGRLRALKVEQLMHKVQKIKEVAGFVGEEGAEDLKDWKKLLEGGFSDEQWDAEMEKRFGDGYYGETETTRPSKPEWNDDIDIGDIPLDFDEEEGGVNLDDDEEEAVKPKKSTRKDFEKEKKEKKKRDRETRKEVEKFVDENVDLDAELSGGKSTGFRYREVTPETFGLTSLDILVADDTALNEYAGLKKYAAYREKERKRQDKKKYSKKRLAREWRKAVFGDENGPVMPTLDLAESAATEEKIRLAGEKAEATGVDSGEKKRKRRKRK